MVSERRWTVMRGSRWGLVWTLSGKSQKFFRITGPDPLWKITLPALPNQHSMLSDHRPTSETFRWWTDDGPLLLLFGSSLLPSSTKQDVARVRPRLTKLSGLEQRRDNTILCLWIQALASIFSVTQNCMRPSHIYCNLWTYYNYRTKKILKIDQRFSQFST